jgi:hypothetical protein
VSVKSGTMKAILVVISSLSLIMMLNKIPLVASYLPIIQNTGRQNSLRIILTRFPSSAAIYGSFATNDANQQERSFVSSIKLNAKPKRGSMVDSYQTVSVNCSKCRQRLFRYKKRNGTKSNLIKCYIERIAEDSAGVLEEALRSGRMSNSDNNEKNDLDSYLGLPSVLPQDYVWACPGCQTQFARSAQIHGRPALKLVGGKVQMTKK